MKQSVMVFGLLTVALGWLLPAVVRAEPADAAKVQARATLREGNILLERGRAAEALAKFEEAYRLFASAKVHYNMGQAHAQLPGHEVQAYQEMLSFLRDAQDAAADLRGAAETQLTQLRSKVGLVFVTAEPADVALVVDGATTGKSAAETTRDTPLVLGVGRHQLALEEDAVGSAPRTVTIAGGETLRLRLSSSKPIEQTAPPPAARAPLLAVGAADPSPHDGSLPSSQLISLPASTGETTRDDSEARPVYRRAWFWGVLAGAAVAVGVGVLVLAGSSSKNPTSTMGIVQVN